MDELLNNYIKHVITNFSPSLKEELNEILLKGLDNEYAIEDIEYRLQNKLIQFFQNLKGNEFEITAKNLFEAYIDYDDENLIRSTRFLIKDYDHNNNIHNNFNQINKIKNENEKKFNKENKDNSSNKINSNQNIYGNMDKFEKYNKIDLYKSDNHYINSNSDVLNKDENKKHNNSYLKNDQNKSSLNNNSNNSSKIKQKEQIFINKSYNTNQNNNSVENFYKANSPSDKNSLNYLDYNYENKPHSRIVNKDEKRMQMKLEKQKNQNKGAHSVTIFDKLFLESYKKNDEKLLNEEIKKISELDECTFQPNSNKR